MRAVAAALLLLLLLATPPAQAQVSHPSIDAVNPPANGVGSATPRIEVDVSDPEGIRASSIQMEVAGLPVDFLLTPISNGYRASYSVPASKRFTHGDVVHVSVRASDNTSDATTFAASFTFTVDDVAPVARLVSIEPSYREHPAHPRNVSLDSLFTLEASDDDGVGNGSASLRYRILGGALASTEVVYARPFRIVDVPGAYTGPRLYQIQYWAEDAVGNVDPTFQTTSVFVDDAPPTLSQFMPQGRTVNATFLDDRVGVDRAVVWQRADDAPYVPTAMVASEGAWTASIPEGPKGTQISYYLQAWDRLGNTETFGNASAPYVTFDVSNHEPTVAIREPAAGARVRAMVDLSWDADDVDGDVLDFVISYRAPGREDFVEYWRLDATTARHHRLDSARFPDGAYTIRITASDGAFVAVDDIALTFLNRVSAIGHVDIEGTPTLGGNVVVHAEIPKANAVVEVQLFRDKRFVGTYPMHDNGLSGDPIGNDGRHAARLSLDAPGDHRVTILARYEEDGVPKETTVEGGEFFVRAPEVTPTPTHEGGSAPKRTPPSAADPGEAGIPFGSWAPLVALGATALAWMRRP